MATQYIPIASASKPPEASKVPETPDEKGSFGDYSYKKENHHQIDRNVLHPGFEIVFSLYSMRNYKLVPILDAADDHPAKIPGSLAEIPGDILIRKSDIPRYEEYLDRLMKNPPSSSDGKKIKLMAVRENSKTIIRELLDDPRSGSKIKESVSLVGTLIENIFDDRDSIYDLLSLRNFDYYTYTHSVNVATLSIGLGISIGMPKDKVAILGIGALLHDLGKSAIPVTILNKQGKLDRLEYDIIKTHVLEGERILLTHNDFPAEAIPAVVQHHEKLSGKGYPNGLSKEGLHIFGKITSIADCYDALTTQRPYKSAFTPFNALSIIVKETSDFDPALLKTFIKMLGKLR